MAAIRCFCEVAAQETVASEASGLGSGVDSSVLITGVSSGIGHGLATVYLQRGWRVLGISRRRPDDLTSHENMRFCSADVAEAPAVREAIRELLDGATRLDLAILNAGILGHFGDMAETPLDDLRHTMEVNLWANKVILDCLFASLSQLPQVVTISSGAAVNGNRGWSGYSISKAALNMLTRLYARECPQTHFCALAPGLVDSALQQQLSELPRDERFPALARLQSKRFTPEMPPAIEAAPFLIDVIDRLPDLVESGDFADVRQLVE